MIYLKALITLDITKNGTTYYMSCDFLQEKVHKTTYEVLLHKIQFNLNLIMPPDLTHSLQEIQAEHTTKYRPKLECEPFYRTKDLCSLTNQLHDKEGLGDYYRINET